MTFPLLKRTLAVLRCPELGFLGFVMPTFKQTPFISGRLAAERAGETACRAFFGCRPRIRTWLSVIRKAAVDVKERVREGKKALGRTVRVVDAAGFVPTHTGSRVRARRACSAEGDGIGNMVGGSEKWRELTRRELDGGKAPELNTKIKG